MSEIKTAPTIDQVVENYHRLCAYCDSFTEKTVRKFGNAIACRKGCGHCCILQSVVALEALLICRYRDVHPARIKRRGKRGATAPPSCVFLRRNSCTIYPVRPIICRTHGLPSRYPSTDRRETCKRNFPGINLASIDATDCIDLESITDNLLRLNLAFCLLSHKQEMASTRIDLGEILEMGFDGGT
ncbi:MAG: YkgJ family cysteine cluster protein [Chitinivibrionales bacterium]|nr:YkgJ family cysteine cluster protein [Chitinivibrionales bacterium]